LDPLLDTPSIIGGDRESANQAFGSWFSALFSPYKAHIYFRPAEQRLLLAALEGLTDEELAVELGISLSAVKKTWLMIHERTRCAWRQTLPQTRDDDANRRRGKERKQHLLSYLRGHMEELRPIMPPEEYGRAQELKAKQRYDLRIVITLVTWTGLCLMWLLQLCPGFFP
jgi:hypothetical protein